MNNQRKLIQLFKAFNERIFVPQIRKTDGSLLQWNKFCALLSNESITVDDLQTYVDSVSTVPERQPTYPERNGFAIKKKTESSEGPSVTPQQSSGFNANKTFGGEKARIIFPPKGDFDDFKRPQEGNHNQLNFGGKDDGQFRKPNPQIILQGLERMSKLFTENQQRIDFLLSNPERQQSERIISQERSPVDRANERYMTSPNEQRQIERTNMGLNNGMVTNNVERLTNNLSVPSLERTGMERQNIERQNIERQNIERQNMERQNINMERQNMERQNIERQNIERQNMMSNSPSMNIERQNMAPPSKYM